jgi:hypothetical protein
VAEVWHGEKHEYDYDDYDEFGVWCFAIGVFGVVICRQNKS